METKKYLQVAKITEEELSKLRDFLQTLSEKVKDNTHYDEDCQESNEEVGKYVRSTFPHREAFVGPLNLGLLLDNYQDKESDVIAHPAWIMNIYNFLEKMKNQLEKNNSIIIQKDDDLHRELMGIIND